MEFSPLHRIILIEMKYSEITYLYNNCTEDEIRTAAAWCVDDKFFDEYFNPENANIDTLRHMVIDAIFEICN